MKVTAESLAVLRAALALPTLSRKSCDDRGRKSLLDACSRASLAISHCFTFPVCRSLILGTASLSPPSLVTLGSVTFRHAPVTDPLVAPLALLRVALLLALRAWDTKPLPLPRFAPARSHAAAHCFFPPSLLVAPRLRRLSKISSQSIVTSIVNFIARPRCRYCFRHS